jgi:hypothetical protein
VSLTYQNKKTAAEKTQPKEQIAIGPLFFFHALKEGGEERTRDGDRRY